MDLEETGVTADDAGQQSQPSDLQVESQQEKNWREMRKTMERLQQRNMELEAERRVREEMSQRQAQPDDDFSLPKEDWVTGQDVEKYTQKLIQKQIQEGVARALQQHEDSSYETRLKTTYADYEAVVTPEAIEDLKYSDPEFVSLIQKSSASNFEKGAAVYKMLKKKKPSARAADNAARLEANQAKPASVHQATRHDVAAKDNLNGRLTPELKKQLYKEMLEASKSR